MAESDRQRLLARALALPQAEPEDFFGGRRAPSGVDGALIKRINDTGLRTKLVETGLAEGLQSPKGPQKIASILRIYPAFDAPARPSRTSPGAASNGRRRAAGAPGPVSRGLPTLEEMAALIERIRDIEHAVASELSGQVDERIERLKRTLAELSGDELETAYRQLGEALEQKRALSSQIRFEAFERIERATDFPARAYLRLLRR